MSFPRFTLRVWSGVVVGSILCLAAHRLVASDLLYSFEDDTTESWTASPVPSGFDDPDAILTVVPGPGNTDGAKSLKVVGHSGDFIRRASVTLDADRLAAFNDAVAANWHLEFDWTIVASENPGAQGYTAQISVGSPAGWSQADLYSMNGYPIWDPAGPEVQTMHTSLPLEKFGSGELGYNGAKLDPTAPFVFINFGLGGGRETSDTRTYYLDNFRLVDPKTTQGMPGDFNDDKTLDAADIDALTHAVLTQSTDTTFDVNGSTVVDDGDREHWVNALRKTYFGDANLDGEFSSADLVAVFAVGEYEDGKPTNSTWADGDWDGNEEFDSGDFVVAFAAGGYERGPRTAVQAVPEPSTMVGAVWTLALAGWHRERRRCQSPRRSPLA